MGAQLTYLKQPIATKEVFDGLVPRRARYGACAMQGWRRGMEDAHLAIPDLTGDGRCSLFGVFDGHGGCAVARFAARYLPELLVGSEAFKREDYEAALSAAFLAVDEKLLTPAGRAELKELDAQGCGRVPLLIPRKQLLQCGRAGGFQKVHGSHESTDADDNDLIDPATLKEVSPEGHGSTAVVALIIWEEDSVAHLFVANAGDSRCVVGRRSGGNAVEAVAMSEDHKPELPSEAARIKAGGGHIQVMPGGARVQGDLNLSRALGDFRHKQLRGVSPDRQIVTASPEVRECKLGPETRLLVLGCDGIWERNENQTLVDKLHCRLLKSSDGSRPLLSTLGAEVCDASLCPAMNAIENPSFDGSGCDNMTILIVEFNEGSLVAAEESVPSIEESIPPTEEFVPVSSVVAEVLEAAQRLDSESGPESTDESTATVTVENIVTATCSADDEPLEGASGSADDHRLSECPENGDIVAEDSAGQVPNLADTATERTDARAEDTDEPCKVAIADCPESTDDCEHIVEPCGKRRRLEET